MSSKFSNKYPIPEKFPEILHDFSREVVRYMPKDILDFSIQYFYYLEQNMPLNYIEGGSKALPKISFSLEQKEKSKESRENLSTPSLTTNSNTQNMFYKQNEHSVKKVEIDKEIKEIKETISSKVNSPLVTEESKHESNNTNGSGVVGLSKNFVGNLFNNYQKKLKEALISEKGIGSDNERIIDVENKGDKFNKSGITFSNISGNSSTKNGVRNFVGGVFDESKKNALDKDKKII